MKHEHLLITPFLIIVLIIERQQTKKHTVITYRIRTPYNPRTVFKLALGL